MYTVYPADMPPPLVRSPLGLPLGGSGLLPGPPALPCCWPGAYIIQILRFVVYTTTLLDTYTSHRSCKHHLAKQRAMSPCSMSVDCPHTPAVRWKRQLHRGATETRPRGTGLENTSVATGPSQQSLRESVLSIISQDPGTSVSEYQIRLSVRHSCKAEPWHRA